MMKRTQAPWMPADRFGASLQGIGFNLLVSKVDLTVRFATSVFNASVVYGDEDFAVLSLCGSELLLHADHTYADHPFSASVHGLEARGGGVEIRLYDVEPDAAEARARERGDVVLHGAMDKPHGMREVFILDTDGYCWVASQPILAGESV